jgi:hypothetical protein
MSDRRYRQQGYRSQGGPPRHEPPPSRPGGEGTFGILKSRPTSRCAECGAVLPITADSLTQCPQCRAQLRACRQCAYFEPARRFECTQPILERISDKRARNECAHFSLMVTVERDTSGGSTRPEDARRAFGNLFKK